MSESNLSLSIRIQPIHIEQICTANYYSHSTAFVQSKDCNANLITAIDSALSLTVIHYSQTTANVQLMTALIAKSDNN